MRIQITVELDIDPIVWAAEYDLTLDPDDDSDSAVVDDIQSYYADAEIRDALNERHAFGPVPTVTRAHISAWREVKPRRKPAEPYDSHHSRRG